MKAKRRTYVTAKAALRLGGDVILTNDCKVIIDFEIVGTVNTGQAQKLLAKGAKISSSRGSLYGGSKV